MGSIAFSNTMRTFWNFLDIHIVAITLHFRRCTMLACRSEFATLQKSPAGATQKQRLDLAACHPSSSVDYVKR